MTRNERSIIEYKEDYDVFGKHESRSIYVNVPGGKEEHEVPISHGKSAEYLIRCKECYSKRMGGIAALQGAEDGAQGRR